jgi:acyl carrier protein
MLLEDFIQKFATCFSETEAAGINAETRFRELEEWGSMMALIVIAMVDADFEKTVTAEDLKSATTVAGLFEIVKSK